MAGCMLAPRRCLRDAGGNLCVLKGNLSTHQEVSSEQES